MQLWLPILAQEDEPISNWLYLLVVFILPMLSQFGVWIREKFGGPKEGDKVDSPDGVGQPAPPVKQATRPARAETVRESKRARQPVRPQVKQARPAPPVAAPAAKRPVRRAKPVSRAELEPILATVVDTADVRTKRPAKAQAAKGEMWLTDADRLASAETTKVEKPPTVAESLIPRNFSPSDLRSAVILSELLQPPVALRDDR